MQKRLFFICMVFSYLQVYAQTDLSDLHAPPTQTEIDAVKAYWSGQSYPAVNWTVLHTGTLSGFTVEIISHEVDGNKHYAAVRYPENYDPMGSYPVLVSNHGGASGVNVVSLNAYQATCFRSFFIALPSFRSEELRTSPIASIDYVSEGTPSEMDGDTDDALALLTGVLAIPGADADRIGVTGGSRGGGVSHLMAAKDNRINRACIFYGATDHMALPGLQSTMENYVDNGGGLNPPEANTYTYGVEPYLNGDLSLTEARLAMLRRSVRYFTDELPLPYQVHHGDADPVVTVNHSQLLQAEFTSQGVGFPDFEYTEYAGATHSLPASTGAPAARETFLCELNDLVLPVELIEFKGVCQEQIQQISLEWAALIDRSAAQFDLQWSVDLENWSIIESLKIREEANQIAEYIYKHTDFENGQNYYRLKETGTDGQVQIHKVIQINCGNNFVSISPNPSTGLIRVSVNSELNHSYPEQISVFDITGKPVHEEILLQTESQEIDLTRLPPGTYSCQFTFPNNRIVKRVVLTEN